MNGVEIFGGWLTPTFLFCVLNLMIGTIYIASVINSQKKSGESEEQPQLVRVPSFLERVKSITHRSVGPDPDHDTVVSAEEQAAICDKLDPDEETKEPRSATGSEVEKTKEKVLKKSASEKVVSERREEEVEVDRRRPATVRESSGGDEAVDAKADDFINRFRQQLKLQRLESIKRYSQMLNRGLGR